ncbi:uncharacterized protein LOC111323849 isoform X2 [Stylophora pistillata]|uniref:uncharacterized protein LOC111323849 isoform X2 n=1 Tax=Stylophora pistillata TaxID=50429 RepID=UPI000C039883|nr:uncharacterized protein LOC111323849 isoform X2 [Stylophora pistillata]
MLVKALCTMAVRCILRNSVNYVTLFVAVFIGDLVHGDCGGFDFENGVEALSTWKKTGQAFDNQPIYRDNPGIRDQGIKTNVQGEWWIATFANRTNATLLGDYPIGTLTSPSFRIKGSNINFLLGGGCDAGKIRVELLVNGKVQRTAFPDNCRDRMRRKFWNVAQFNSNIGQIRLVDASRKAHVNFDDLKGDFSCTDVGKTFSDLHDDNYDEPLDPVNPVSSDTKSQDNAVIGTEDDYNTMQMKPTQKLHDGSIKIGKGRPLYKGLLGAARAKNIFEAKTPSKPPPLRPVAASKPFMAPTAKLAHKQSFRDSDNKSALPRDDELRNLTCKNFIVEIKTGLPWDNDFLFPSNANYQATRRATELKVLRAFDENKDFRGAFFDKFSSSEEPSGVKAYFLLRFRANGKFIGKLLDNLGPGNVSAAGCYPDTPITQCSSSCPSTCAPACLYSCCQPSVSAPAAPQPVYQPAPVHLPPPLPPPPPPPPPPQPVAVMAPSPQVYQPPQRQWNVQITGQATIPPPRALSPQYPMSQPLSWPGSQCSSRCSPTCAPICSPICCQFYNSERNEEIKKTLKKEAVQEEKH